MKLFAAIAALLLGLLPWSADSHAQDTTGAELFKRHCALCHPDGGNIIRPEKTLSRKHLEQHNVRTAGDIIHLMRNPGRGMTRFSEEALPGDDAQKIADYILETFK